MKAFARRGAVLAMALGLAACGGSGGSGDDGATLSGRIDVIESSAVDSDLNDPGQSDYRRNDNPANPNAPDAAWAQNIATPVLLTGTVNAPRTGSAGRNFDAGDRNDYFAVDLLAGQTVELEFAADPDSNDVDLYVYDAGGSEAGVSDGTDTRFECVQVTRSGRYYVNPYAFEGASIYSLRIGAPGTAGSCATTTAAFGTTALLAREHAAGSPKALAARALADHRSLRSQAGLALEAAAGLGPQMLRLPATSSARRAGLERLQGSGRSTALDGNAAKSALAADAAAPSRLEALATTLRYAKALRASGAYAYVEPDWILQRAALTGAFPPDDRYYTYQKWHYEQIRLPAAMNRVHALASQPAQRPLVAVIDSGVVLDHPDLAPQLQGSGYSFVGGRFAPSGDDQSRAADDSVFHGTHVAGTIAAQTYDGQGAAGVAPMAQILALNVFGAGSGASTSDIVDAILYAARLGNRSGALPTRRADVINMSLGGGGSCSAAFQNAITAARNAGVIVVAATGNESRAVVGQPANCNGVIAVSATQADRSMAPYSNTGSAVKVAAPGGNTGRSSTGNGQPDGVFSTMASFDSTGRRIATLGFLQGTSMASPHVAGVMALMRYLDPTITPTDVDALLAAGSLTDDLGNSGFDTQYGHGLINADKAVLIALNRRGGPVPTPAGQVVAEPGALDFGSFQSTAVLRLAHSGSSSERVSSFASDHAALTLRATSVDGNGLGSYSVEVNRAALANGSHFLTARFSLSSGRILNVPVAVTRSTSSGGRAGGFGPLYVLLLDPDSGDVLQQAVASYAAGSYTWRITGVTASRVSVIAGTDLDNDGYICQRGEACGGYPLLEAVIDGQAIAVGSGRSDLNFQVAPLSGISAQSTRRSTVGAGVPRESTRR